MDGQVQSRPPLHDDDHDFEQHLLRINVPYCVFHKNKTFGTTHISTPPQKNAAAKTANANINVITPKRLAFPQESTQSRPTSHNHSKRKYSPLQIEEKRLKALDRKRAFEAGWGGQAVKRFCTEHAQNLKQSPQRNLPADSTPVVVQTAHSQESTWIRQSQGKFLNSIELVGDKIIRSVIHSKMIRPVDEKLVHETIVPFGGGESIRNRG